MPRTTKPVLPPERLMIQAMTQNDTSYNGRFYVGVHSTGIYCLPSCKAKLPLLKNVIFYATREEAISAGLRGCKRCRSDRFPDILPEWVTELMRFLNKHYQTKLTEADLMAVAGVDISTIRRYFKTHHNCTPLSFHRRLRLNYARQLLSNGENYLQAAYESGYESVSGFRDAFKQQFGITPGRIHER